MATSKNKDDQEVIEEFYTLAKEGKVPEEILDKWMEYKKASTKKKETDSFKSFINKNKKSLFKFLETPISASVRHSGHFVDQKLKNKRSANMMTFFEEVGSTDLKNKIKNNEIEVKTFGIQLTPTEDRLLNALQRLLHEKSQNTKPGTSDYYMGNESNPVISYGKEQKASPTICVKPSELYKAFLEKTNYSSHEIKHVRETLSKLEHKKFLLQYKKTRFQKKKGHKAPVPVYDMIEELQSLVKVVKFVEGIEFSEDTEGKNLDSLHENRGGVVISLNPILVDQINSKYVEYPENINKRMTLAAGGPRSVTESMNLLRDFLLRAISAKQSRIEIEHDKLIYTLRLDKMLKNRQKKRLEDRIASAIDVSKKLGILTDHQLATNKLGMPKHIFILNQNFNKE